MHILHYVIYRFGSILTEHVFCMIKVDIDASDRVIFKNKK